MLRPLLGAVPIPSDNRIVTAADCTTPRLPLTGTLAARGAVSWRDQLVAFVRTHRVAAAMVAVLAVAAVLRLANLGHNSLTHDECIRANWSHHGDLNLLRWFPPGQLAILWTTQHLLPRNEWVLRLPVALLGLAAVFLCFSVTRRRLGDWPAVLAAAYLALNTQAVVHSRAAKEVGYEPALTLLLIWAGAQAAETTRKSHIALFFGAAVAGLLFGLSTVMVATAWGLVILWTCLRQTADRRGLRFHLLLTATFTPVVCAWYIWLDGCTHHESAIKYMGYMEHAWPTGYSPLDLARWGLANSFGLLRFLTGARGLWEPVGPVLLVLDVFFALAGLGELRRRWPNYLKFACALLALNIALAAAVKWPYGNYRMSVFWLPVFAPLVGCGLAYTLRRLRCLPAGAFLLLLWLTGPTLQSAKGTVVDPREYDHARPVVRAMQQHVRPDDGIFVYYAAGISFEFYWPNPDAEVHTQDITSRGHFDLFRREFDALAETHPRVWVFFTHVYGDEGEEWSAYALRQGHRVHEFRSKDAFAYCIEVDRAPDP